MFCRKCGAQLNDDAVFCQFCGEKLVDEAVEISPAVEQNVSVEPKGPWKVFATIGKVLGIVSMACILIPFFSFALAIDGIILSALGKKSVERRSSANVGLTLSIIACAVNFVYSIVIYIFALVG